MVNAWMVQKFLILLVLLSLRHNAWQVSDFGLTQQGTSRIARYTHHGRGTEGYRGPEMVRGLPLVSRQTDIFSLGCIVYELATGCQLFKRDYDLFEFMSARQRPFIAGLQMDDRSRRILVPMMYGMLEVDWWKRPAAQDILNGLDALSIRSDVGPDCINMLRDSFEELNMDSNAVEPSFKGDGDLLEWRPHWSVSYFL
jgi:serine/threonine protein kinase